jgi:outer membrane protein
MNEKRELLFVLALAATALAAARASQAEPAGGNALRSGDAVALAAKNNPDLKTALLEERRAQEDVTAEEGLRPFVLQLDGGYTRSSMPRADSDGDVTFTNGDGVAIGGQVSKATAIGTEAAVRIDGNAAPNDPTTYGLAARLSVTQPLLRGAGRTVNEATLRQARAAQEIARLSASKAASALARDTLVAYWELWYAARALEIDGRARDEAVLALEETRAKIQKGAAAPVDALQYETNVATLEETVVAAAAVKRQLAVQLGVLIGRTEGAARLEADPNEAPQEPALSATPDQVLRAALADSPDVRQSAASVAAAEEGARTAGEAMRQRLDLVGWIGAQTLGVDAVSPAFEQLGQGPAYSAYVGLVWELPLGDTRKDAQRASARLGVEIARQQLDATGAQVRADVAVSLDAIDSARQKVALAEQTLEAARKQAEAERQRYALGASIYIVVRDAEEAQRQAELRVVRARVELVEAQVKLDHVTGTLLARLGDLR